MVIGHTAGSSGPIWCPAVSKALSGDPLMDLSTRPAPWYLDKSSTHIICRSNYIWYKGDIYLYVQYCALLNLHNFKLKSGYVLVICIMSFLHYVLRYFKTLDIIWSLVRCQVTRRLSRFQTMCTVLENHKTLSTIWCGCSLILGFYSIYLNSVLYA